MRKMDSAEEDARTGRRMVRTRWSKEMEKLIIDLWEENIEDYFGARKRRLIYKDISESISAAGYPMQWTDVRNKFENLTRKYKSERDKILASQGNTPSRWRYFDKMHSLLSNESQLKIAIQENQIFSKAAEDENESEQSLEDVEDVETDQDTQAELLVIAREQLKIQREEQMFNREHRRAQLKVLKYIARSQDRLQSLLVQLLTDTNENE